MPLHLLWFHETISWWVWRSIIQTFDLCTWTILEMLLRKMKQPLKKGSRPVLFGLDNKNSNFHNNPDKFLNQRCLHTFCDFTKLFSDEFKEVLLIYTREQFRKYFPVWNLIGVFMLLQLKWKADFRKFFAPLWEPKT